MSDDIWSRPELNTRTAVAHRKAVEIGEIRSQKEKTFYPQGGWDGWIGFTTFFDGLLNLTLKIPSVLSNE